MEIKKTGDLLIYIDKLDAMGEVVKCSGIFISRLVYCSFGCKSGCKKSCMNGCKKCLSVEQIDLHTYQRIYK